MNYIASPLFAVQLALQALLLLLVWALPAAWAESFLFGTAALLLCLIGIPHGANDLLYRRNKSWRGAAVFLSLYLGSMALYAGLWYLAPVLALLIFFLISVHHFGQSNFESEQLWHAPSLLWGGLLLLYPVALHQAESFGIFQQMMGLATTLPPPTLLLAAAALLTLVYLALSYRSYPAVFGRLLLQCLLIIGWLYSTNLLGGFIIVFCLWHSLQSLYYQWGYYQQAYQHHPRPLRLFVANMAAYTLLALGFLWVCSLFLPLSIALLFILLSIITLPHAAVMDFIYKDKTA